MDRLYLGDDYTTNSEIGRKARIGNPKWNRLSFRCYTNDDGIISDQTIASSWGLKPKLYEMQYRIQQNQIEGNKLHVTSMLMTLEVNKCSYIQDQGYWAIDILSMNRMNINIQRNKINPNPNPKRSIQTTRSTTYQFLQS